MVMVPYGLSLAAVSMVGHSLGGNKPREAVKNSQVIFAATTGVCIIVVLSMNLFSSTLVGVWTQDPAVAKIAEGSFLVFSVAFAFDWS